MDFQIEQKKNHNTALYDKEDIDIAYEFSKNVKKELGNLLKAIVLFGSAARTVGTNKKAHDIDILLILDDVSINFSPELIQTYRIIVEKIVARVSRKLHITSLKLTNFWEYVRAGDPIAVNMLRDGVALIDTGFYEPLQILLKEGRIRPSSESIHNYMMLAPQTLQNSRMHLVQATLDLYWAVIDAAHAALMYTNEVPPSPGHVADMMDEKLVRTGLVDKRYAHVMRTFYNLSKSISHGQLTEVTGDQYDAYYKEAFDFVLAMKGFIEKR